MGQVYSLIVNASRIPPRPDQRPDARGVGDQRRPHKGPRGVWQAPGGAAWRVQNDDISLVFMWFSCFACMPCLLIMLWALAGDHVEPKAGFVDAALVLYAFCVCVCAS